MIDTYRRALTVFFGNKQHELSLEDIKQARYSKALQKIVSEMSLDSMVILNQQHTAQGFCVEDRPLFKHSLYQHTGDFLITDIKRCGLVILTADCVPVIIYDQSRGLVGAIHAGWKGSHLGVVLQAIMTMKNSYGSNTKDLCVWFGASARSCCYEVKQDFYKSFESYSYAQKAFVKRNNKLYFDNKQFITLQLQTVGIKLENIYDKQTMCTICSLDQCSFRREKERAGRQVTVVSLL